MIIRFEDLSPTRTYDVCVVGSGPAGMSVAIALATKGKSCLLLEGGTDLYTEESQDSYRGQVVGDPYFDLQAARLRFLGGTSGHWAGWCRPLDQVDFEKKSHAPLAHWPIRKADLDPYVRVTHEILDIKGRFDDMSRGDGIKQLILYSIRPVVRFAEKYRKSLESSRLVDLCMTANLTGVQLGGGGVNSLEVTDYANLKRQVRAKSYVIACGGIDNSRMLLHLNRQTGGALMKDARALGRYWMEHPTFELGHALVRPFPEKRSFYGLEAATKQQLGLLNCGFRFQPVPRSTWRQMADQLACVAPSLSEGLYQAMSRDLVCGARLEASWEQEPRAVNHVALDPTEKDRFGIPRPILHWTKSARDHDTLKRSAQHFGAFLARSGMGSLRLDPWVLGKGDYPTDGEFAGYHHMGGTRMSDTPALGVVDRDCRVFGQDNLFVAGSSVFPSTGHTNPTYAIVQLALRLGDHLAART